MVLSSLYILGMETNFWPLTNRFSLLQRSWVMLCPWGSSWRTWWPHFLWSLRASLQHCNLACLQLKEVRNFRKCKKSIVLPPQELIVLPLWAVPVQVHNVLGYGQVSVLSPGEVPHGFHWVSQTTKGCRIRLVKASLELKRFPAQIIRLHFISFLPCIFSNTGLYTEHTEFLGSWFFLTLFADDKW